MTSTSFDIYQKYLLDYLKSKFSYIKSNMKNFDCPFCNKKSSATIINTSNSYTFHCYNPNCDVIKGNIFDIVRRLDMPNASEEDIADYLTHLFDIKTDEQGDKLLEMYSKSGWSLIPLAPNTKIPIKGSIEWQKTEYKDKRVWKDWLDRGYNLGLSLGEKSQVVAVDCDSLESYERIKHLLGDTLFQRTGNGWHYIYKYDPIFFKTLNKVLKDDGWQLELRTTGAYIVIAPSIAYDGDIREWNGKKIIEMPKELKEFFQKYYDKTPKKEDTVDESVQKAIDSEKLDIVDLSNKRNDTFIKTAGIFSKWMPQETVKKVLMFLGDNWIDKPLPKNELYAILNQVKKYRTFDKEQLGKEVLERLEITKENGAFQLAKSMNLEQKDVENVLNYLEKEGKVIAIGKNRYKKLDTVKWSEDYNSETGVPVDFVVPFFSDYAYFNWQDILIISAPTGFGKTYISVNFLKYFVNQKKKPYLINTESGSRIGKIAHKIGLKVGDFFMTNVKSANEVEFPDNSIVIIDWLQIPEGDFSKISVLYEHLHNQVKKHNCFLIVMTQLKKDNTHFANNIHDWYASFTARYQYGNNGHDSINTMFLTDKIRERKCSSQFITIPTKFDKETGIIISRDNEK